MGFWYALSPHYKPSPQVLHSFHFVPQKTEHEALCTTGKCSTNKPHLTLLWALRSYPRWPQTYSIVPAGCLSLSNGWDFQPGSLSLTFEPSLRLCPRSRAVCLNLCSLDPLFKSHSVPYPSTSDSWLRNLPINNPLFHSTNFSKLFPPGTVFEPSEMVVIVCIGSG